MHPDDGFKDAKVERHLAALAALPETLKDIVREVLRDELPRLLGRVHGDVHRDADLLDVEAAAARLGLGKSTVRKLASRCDLPSVPIGRRLLFRPADLDAYAAARRRSPERVRKLSGGQP